MLVGDIVRLRPNYRRMISDMNEQCPLMGTVVHVNMIGNIDILLTNFKVIKGVMLGNVEKINETS